MHMTEIKDLGIVEYRSQISDLLISYNVVGFSSHRSMNLAWKVLSEIYGFYIVN